MVTRRDVFQAIADPTRREIIALLSKKSYNLNTMVGEFEVSRPAIAKHLKILAQCGLVAMRKEGREKFYDAKLHGLAEVSQWTEQYRVFWSKKLDALELFLKAKENKRPSKRKKIHSNIKSGKQ